MAADLGFTFDPSAILKGISQVNDQMDQMGKGFKKGAQNMSKAVTAGVLKATAVVGGLVAAFKGMTSVIKQYVPEIGQAFKIVKDIFFKNFLWPLRKELMPLLQKLLDWTRQNRTRFIQWGQSVANAFRAIITVVKSIIRFTRSLLEQIAGVFKVLFGDQVKSIEEMWNLLTAKVAIAAIFIGNILQGIVGWFASIAKEFGPAVINTLRGVIQSLLAFVEGFLSEIAGIETSIMNIFGNVAKFVEGLFSPNKFGDKIQDVFRLIGETAGMIFKDVTELVDKFLEPFLLKIGTIVTPLKNIMESIKDLWSGLFDEQAMEGLGKLMWFLGEITGAAFMTALHTVALAVGFIADSLLLAQKGFRVIMPGGDKDAEKADWEETLRRADERTYEGWGKILGALGIERGGGAASLTSSPVINVYPPAGTDPVQLADLIAESVEARNRALLDEELRARGE